MKMKFGALLVVTVILAGCEAPPKAADAGNKAADTASATSTPKRKCTPSTGSRMGSCDGSTPDVTGANGDNYRDANMNRGTLVGGRPN